MTVNKEFIVRASFTDRDGCANPQKLTAGDVVRAIEKTGVENLHLHVLDANVGDDGVRPIEKLDVSPTPWKVGGLVKDRGGFRTASIADGKGYAVVAGDSTIRLQDAALMTAAPDLYEAAWDCCEEVNERNVPRCYACRRGGDGHCMARHVCKLYLALMKASGKEVAV